MASIPMTGSSARIFALSVIARFVGKDLATVRKWFDRIPGVRKYPRGYGKQNPSLGIPEAILRAKLMEIGYTPAEIDTGLLEPYDRRLIEDAHLPAEGSSPPPHPPKIAGKSGKSRKPKTKITYSERRRRR